MWFVGACVAVLVGCGGGTGIGGPIPFSAFESAAGSAVCNVLVVCGDVPDEATCLASDQVEPHYYDTLGQDIAAGKVSYDGAKARSCIDGLNAISSCDRTTLADLTLAPDCNGVFTGTVAPGGACFFSQECAAGGSCQSADSVCDPLHQCCAGTCARLVTVAAGGDCTGIDAQCAAGTLCVFSGTGNTGTCVTLVTTPGATCGGTIPCAPPLYCDTVSNTCKTPVATGGACNPGLGSIDCANLRDLCDAASSSCKPRIAVGSPCPGGADCVSYAYCDATSGNCVELPAVGRPCSLSAVAANGDQCLGGVTCDPTTSLCTLIPTGGACS